MKILATPKHLSEAVAPLMILNYLTGLRIFEYPRGKLRVLPSLIYIFFLLGIYYVSAYVELQHYKNAPLLKLEYILYDILMYACSFTFAYEVFLGCLYTKRINDCYERMIQVDDTLRQLGSIFNYRRIYFFTTGAVIFWFLYILVLVSIMMVQIQTNLLTTICLIISEMYASSISFVIIFEFSIFVKCLEMKFKLVNELLNDDTVVSSMEGMRVESIAEDSSEMSDSEQRAPSRKQLSQLNRQMQSRARTFVPRNRILINSPFHSRPPSQLQKQFGMELQGQFSNQSEDPNSIQRSIAVAECDQKHKHLLQTTRQVHLELCKISKALCMSFGTQIISVIGICIMMISLFLYNLYDFVIARQLYPEDIVIKEIVLIITLEISYVLKLIIVNHVCKNATSEGKKTTEIIHAIYGYSVNVEVREEIEQFDLQISQSPVDFFAFGVSLNYDYLRSCLATVSTYLVIMIQMSSSLESNKNI